METGVGLSTTVLSTENQKRKSKCSLERVIGLNKILMARELVGLIVGLTWA
jgi:hypothetical protein